MKDCAKNQKNEKFNTYLQVYKMQIIRSLTYKFDVYGNIIMQSIIMLASAFFWKALYAGNDSVQGVGVSDMMVYTVVSSMISVVLTTNVERRISNSVSKGTIAIDMMRPVDIYKVFFAENLAGVTTLIFQNLLPILLIGSIFIGVPVPASKEAFLLFVLSLFMSFCINWFIAVIFGMFSFKVIEMDALIQVKKHLIRLLSGSIIPVWFFPESLKNILSFLPFVYLYQLPLDIYIGKYDSASLTKGLIMQELWVVVLYLMFRFFKKKAEDKVMIQGG